MLEIALGTKVSDCVSCIIAAIINRIMAHREIHADPRKGLLRLIASGPKIRMGMAEKIVAQNRRLIRKAMRLGHSVDAIAAELSVPKRTLLRHLNNSGIFFRKPRTKKGAAVKKNSAAISRAKMRILANV